MSVMTDNFQKLIEKYRFVESVNPDVRKLVISASRQKLINIIKDAGDYSFIYGKTLSLYYRIRKAGYRISFSGAKLTLAAVSFAIITSTAITGYFVFKHLMPEQVKITKTKRIVAVPAVSIKKSAAKKSIKPVRKFKYEVQHFSAENNETGSKISRMITANLQKKFGQKNVTLVKKLSNFIVEQIILGSVKSFDKFDVITVKLINVSTGKIEYVTNETVFLNDKYENACQRIADRIYINRAGK